MKIISELNKYNHSLAITKLYWNLNHNHKYMDIDFKLASRKLSKALFNEE